MEGSANDSHEQNSSLAIPHEILLHIFSFLPTNVLCQMRLVCHDWKDVADEPQLWKHKCFSEFFLDCGAPPEKIQSYFQDETINWKNTFQKRTEALQTLHSFKLVSTDSTLAAVEEGVVAKYVGWDGTGMDSEAVGVVQSDKPIIPLPFGIWSSIFYYEVKIIDAGTKGFVGIGLAREGYRQAEPGWRPRSFGYHGDDGRAYHHSGWGRPWGPLYSTGDTVGCIFNMSTREIAYTKNGEYIGVAFKDVKLFHGPYYATVGLHSESEVVIVNFGENPFEFDIISYIKSQNLTPVELPLPPPEQDQDRNPEDSDMEDVDLGTLIRKLRSEEETDDNDPAFIEDLRHLVRGLGYDAIDTRGMSVSKLRQLVGFLITLDSIRKQNATTTDTADADNQEGEEEENGDVEDMQ